EREAYNKLFDSQEEILDKTKKKERKELRSNKTIKINTQDLRNRIERVSKKFGTQNKPLLFSDSENTTLFYLSNEDGGAYSLFKKVYKPFQKEKDTKVSNDYVSQIVQKDKKEYYFLTRKGISKYNEANDKTELLKINHSFQKNLEEEFQQMFEETWAGLEENFYEESFH